MVAQQDYHRIQVPHSDGQDSGPGYWPTPGDAEAAKAAKKPGAVADKTPRVKPQMVRLAEDDPRFVEWRIKLGILLKQELSPTPQEGLSWYVEFPRGYWLYEKSKHLWVSGYPVKSKLFKSPQEFGVHLLWLISGSTNPSDCCCIHCNPPKSIATADELSVVESKVPQTSSAGPPAQPAVPKTARAKATKITPSNTPTPTTTPPIAAQSTTKIPAPAAVPAATPATVPAPAVTTTQTLEPLRPSAPPVARNVTAEAAAPTPYNQKVSSLFFRIGELVWFQVLPSWRIGLIARANYSTKQYEILPISHGSFSQSQLQAKVETELRPFLAFTVPPVALPALQGKSFDNAPWEAMFQLLATEPQKREAILLDASKMAALKISQSYSLFTHLFNSEGDRKANYHGIFLGAERIEVDDTIRVRIANAPQSSPQEWTDALLGLREICTASTTPGAVYFKGDTYLPLTGDEPMPLGATDVPPELLPAALRDEVLFRAQINPAARWRMVLLRRNVVLREDDIRGRFYPSNRLLPVLAHPDLQTLQRELSEGKVRESARQLNQRMDTLKDGYIGRQRNRAETIGSAVPHGSDALFGYEAAVVEAAAGSTAL